MLVLAFPMLLLVSFPRCCLLSLALPFLCFDYAFNCFSYDFPMPFPAPKSAKREIVARFCHQAGANTSTRLKKDPVGTGASNTFFKIARLAQARALRKIQGKGGKHNSLFFASPPESLSQAHCTCLSGSVPGGLYSIGRKGG